MENLSNSVETTTAIQSSIFDNAISIEKLEERMETTDTCPNIMAF